MFSHLKNNKSNAKEELFLKNGSIILEQLIISFNGSCNPIRTYSIEDLNMATNNFHSDRLLHWDIYYDFYSGVHKDHKISVKKFKFDEISRPYEDPLKSVANEVAIASQMSNHKNVLKLLGCCLETELPILVYEFPENGNLESAIANKEQLPWHIKLRIAYQVAQAVSYLHHGFSKMFIHRVIKVGNVYLDKDYTAKLSEFQSSLPIPAGKTHVVAQVIGTGGRIAPEAHMLRHYTEKTDVFSFGVLLFDILIGKNLGHLLPRPQLRRKLTGSKAVDDWDGGILDISEDEYVEHSDGEIVDISEDESGDDWGEESLCRIMEDNNKLQEGKRDQVIECVKLIDRCLKWDPNVRPNMIEVAKALRFIKIM